MTKFRFTIFVLFLILASSASLLAQTSPSPKVGYINSEAFYDEKLGIAKLIAANKQLDTEFGTRIRELQTGATRLQAISKELENMQKLPQTQFNEATFNLKKDEGETLQRELNYKKTDLETAISKRREILVSPINKDIGAGIDEFAKKNGYGMIIDVAKLIDAGSVLYFAEAADATKDFITFFNARVPARPAATTPK